MLRNLWEHFEVYIANFSLLLMVGFLTLQIIARYFFQVGIAWTEELSRFSFLYFVYLSSCFVMMKGRHIRVECLVNVLPLSVRNWIEVFGDMLHSSGLRREPPARRHDRIPRLLPQPDAASVLLLWRYSSSVFHHGPADSSASVPYLFGQLR